MAAMRVFSIIALFAFGEAARVDIDGTSNVEAAAENLEAEEQALAENLEAEERALAEDLEAEEQAALAEDLAEERDESANPYWYAHQGSWEFVAPNLTNSQYVQQFEMKEGYHFVNRKYEVKLDEFEDVDTGKEVYKNINAKVLRVDDYFFTMYRYQSAVFKNTDGVQVGDYLMFKPQLMNRRYTWRVAKKDKPDEILFTIQKRLWNDHCKYFDLFSCRPVLKIYVGRRGDKSTLIYYGVGDKDLDEPDFKLYHAISEYKNTKHKWVAKIDHKKTKGHLEKDTYKIKVKPNEDAGLILLAAVALDRVGDDARAAEDAGD